MIRNSVFALGLVLALSGCGDQAGGQGGNRDQIKIVGSSTVLPFAKAVAERYAANSKAKSPIVESTGTGGGIKLFCAGIGANHPDIANASRQMKSTEFDECNKNGVTEIVEIQVGIDGIVVAGSKAGPKFALTQEHIYQAIAANPYGKKNTSKTWQDVDASLPAVAISVYGPPSTSGTRDALTELIMETGCKTDKAIAAMQYSDKEKFEAICHDVRTDGPYVDAGENDNLIVQKLKANPESVGIFGYSFLEENLADVNGISIGGVAPSYDAIASGSYPGARPLYIYLKKQHVGRIPGLQEFVKEFVAAGGEDGYLKKIGMITAPEQIRSLMQSAAEQLPILRSLDLR